ncbi:MAG: hypothetical protein AB1643_01035 [Patescibacteria group bacterium]
MPEETTIEEERMANLQTARFQDEQDEQADEEEEKKIQKTKQRISNITAILIIIVALLYDGLDALISLLQAIPVIGGVIAIFFGSILDIWAWLTFYVWFKVKGVSLSDSIARAICYNAGLLLELIPVLGALPFWTLSVIIMILIVKAEDKLAKVPIVGKAVSMTTGATAGE